MATETIPPFTDPARILSLVGDLGVELRLDDSPDADDALDRAIEAGTLDLYYYLQRYSAASIADSTWAQANATWFAVRALCQRRLNEMPKSVMDECARREKMLQMILERKATAPGIAASRRPLAVTGYTVDLRRWNNQIRVDRNRSTGVAQDYVRPVDNSSPDDRG